MSGETRPTRARPRVGRGRGDTGLATTEMAVIAPVFFVMVLLPIHFALWWHAKQTIDLAAEEALDAAQIEGSSEGDGVAAANAVIGQVGNIENPTVSVQIAGDVVTVQITGRSRFRVVPGGWHMSSTAEGRVERFIGAQER